MQVTDERLDEITTMLLDNMSVLDTLPLQERTATYLDALENLQSDLGESELRYFSEIAVRYSKWVN